mmetsp:Transcript_27835/g.39833  ORF Transcript_27835/g.39833 Transcript_27835/m.39833 type:complete len:367 (+) Transcript_27835:171-1271(+)
MSQRICLSLSARRNKNNYYFVVCLALLMIAGCAISFTRQSPILFSARRRHVFSNSMSRQYYYLYCPTAAAAPVGETKKNSQCYARYGPKEDDEINASNSSEESLLLQQQTDTLRDLVKEIIEAKPPQSLPSIVTKYLDVLLAIKGEDGVKALKLIVQEASQPEEAEVACEYILNFMEAFVEEAKAMEETNKLLLGKIMRAISPSDTTITSSSSTSSTSRSYREEKLDTILQEEKDNFTPGFLRHVENECRRLANSSSITKDSTRLLETLQIIYLRILEELGKNLGEGALVLGQLVGYDDAAERIAVLEGALTVRGVHFAKELSTLTKEVLEGFQEQDGKVVVVDQELVDRVKDIDDRLNGYLDWNG